MIIIITTIIVIIIAMMIMMKLKMTLTLTLYKITTLQVCRVIPTNVGTKSKYSTIYFPKNNSPTPSLVVNDLVF